MAPGRSTPNDGSVARHELTFSRLLLPVVERAPERTAVSDATYRATYATHLDRTARVGRALAHEYDVGPADRFSVLAHNGHEYAELWHAAFLGAGVMHPLNFRLAPDELAFVLADSGTRVVVADPAFADLLERALAEMPAAARPPVVSLGAPYEDLLASDDPVLPDEPDESAPATLMYTGGTTGTPKGVVLSHRAQILNLYHHQMVLRPEPGTVYLHQSPMFHGAAVYGLLGPVVGGGEMVILPRFDPAGAVAAIEASAVTETQMAPTMIALLLDDPACTPERLRSLRRLIFGGAPMATGLFDRLRRAVPHLELFHGYGMTEVASVLTYFPNIERAAPERRRSVGRPVPGVVVSVQDGEGTPLPLGEVGEICARGGNLMTGYWNRAEETAEAFRGGWYHSGDVGRFDEDGYLYLLDRTKDMIISGGENVYSIEVEHALSTHPAVAQVAVIGVPHELWGEQVHAVVVLHPGATATADELRDHARRTIAGYKVPKTVDLRTEPLPVSATMKVLKRALLAAHLGSGRGDGGAAPSSQSA